MHAAPAVGVRCAGGAAWRAFRSLVPGVAAAAFVGWLLARVAGAGHAMTALGAGLAAAAVALACWRLAAPATVQLRWDGSTWIADEDSGMVDVMIDLGGWMLLRLRPEAGVPRARWMAVSAHDAGPAWSALRAAAHAGRPPQPSGPPAPLR